MVLNVHGMNHSRLVTLAPLLLGSAVLVGMAFVVAPALIPGTLLLAVMFLLLPLRKNALVARMMITATLLVIIWFLAAVAEILLFFIMGMLLVYVIEPDSHQARRARGSPVGLIAHFCLDTRRRVTAFVALGTPGLVAKLGGVDQGLRAILREVTDAIESGTALPGTVSFGASPSEAGKAITRSVGPQASAFVLGALEAILDFLTSFARLAQHVINLAVLPFFVFFLLKDLPRLADLVVKAVPDRQRERFVAVVGRLDDILGRYFRGAIVVAAIQGAISGTGLWIIGIKYPLLLGIITGFLDFFPYVGLFISLVLSALVAYAGGGAFLTKIILITLLYLSQKLLEDCARTQDHRPSRRIAPCPADHVPRPVRILHGLRWPPDRCACQCRYDGCRPGMG